MSELRLPVRDAIRSRRATGAGARAANGLRFAAAPTFALMALLTSRHGGEPDALCAVAQNASPFDGMFIMYILMGVFHSAPCLRLFSRQ